MKGEKEAPWAPKEGNSSPIRENAFSPSGRWLNLGGRRGMSGGGRREARGHIYLPLVSCDNHVTGGMPVHRRSRGRQTTRNHEKEYAVGIRGEPCVVRATVPCQEEGDKKDDGKKKQGKKGGKGTAIRKQILNLSHLSS